MELDAANRKCDLLRDHDVRRASTGLEVSEKDLLSWDHPSHPGPSHELDDLRTGADAREPDVDRSNSVR